jgi:hypothetical protein
MSGILFNGNIRTSRNLLKNPAFSVIQGTASGTIPNSLAVPTASLGYAGETEWVTAASGGTPAYAFSSTDERITFTGAAGTTAIYFAQRLESRDTNRLKGKTVTLSVELSNSLLTSVIWELFRPTTTDTHGTIASPTQTVVASGTWTVTSTLTRYTATVTLPAEVSNGLEVRFRVAAQTSGTWVISRPKLEEGSTATAFVCDDYAIELAKCQRYFQRMTGYFIGYFFGTGGLASESRHPGMFGTSRIRTLLTQISLGGGSLTLDPGTTEDSTLILVTGSGGDNNGIRCTFTVSAHIP